MLAWLAASLLVLEPPVLPDPPGPGVPEPEAVELVPAPIEAPPSEPAPPVEPAPPLESEPAVAPAPPPPPVVTPLEPDDPAPTFRVGHGVPSSWVEVERPTFRGTGLIVGAAAAFGFGVAFQVGDRVLCGGCGPGFIERVGFAHAFALAAAAGTQRGRADAFDDAVLKRTRDTRRAKLAGSALLGLGLAIGIVNEGLWWSYVASNEGPYSEHDPTRSIAISRAILDIATLTGSTGVGLLTWQARYRRDRAAYRNARVLAVSPSFAPALAGVTLQGRF